MDIMLEGNIDGIETANKIKTTYDVPIIYITAYVDNETFQRAKITEPYGYIIKPFEDLELKTIIEIALYNHKKSKELKEKEKKYRELYENTRNEENNTDEESINKGKFSKRQQEIITTALNIISEEGIQQLTIKKIADKLNITDAAIYKHFKGRSEILSGIIKMIGNVFNDSFEKLVSSNKSPLKRLEALFIDWLEKYSHNQSFIPITLSEDILKGESDLDESINDLSKKRQKMIIDCIIEGQKIGEIRNNLKPTHLSLILTGTVSALAYEWNSSDLKFDIVREGKEIWETVSEVIQQQK
jgi:AcrR family transcriptional regulator